MCWGTVFNVMGKAHKGSKRHCAKGWVAGGATHAGTSLGNKDPALDLQTQDATGRGVGNRQSKNCSYDDDKVAENVHVLFGRIVR